MGWRKLKSKLFMKSDLGLQIILNLYLIFIFNYKLKDYIDISKKVEIWKFFLRYLNIDFFDKLLKFTIGKQSIDSSYTKIKLIMYIILLYKKNPMTHYKHFWFLNGKFYFHFFPELSLWVSQGLIKIKRSVIGFSSH